jgi:hypothetical protein
MKQDCQLAGDGDGSTITGLLVSKRGQVQAPLSQGRVSSMRPEDMVGALDQ